MYPDDDVQCGPIARAVISSVPLAYGVDGAMHDEGMEYGVLSDVSCPLEYGYIDCLFLPTVLFLPTICLCGYWSIYPSPFTPCSQIACILRAAGVCTKRNQAARFLQKTAGTIHGMQMLVSGICEWYFTDSQGVLRDFRV